MLMRAEIRFRAKAIVVGNFLNICHHLTEKVAKRTCCLIKIYQAVFTNRLLEACQGRRADCCWLNKKFTLMVTNILQEKARI